MKSLKLFKLAQVRNFPSPGNGYHKLQWTRNYGCNLAPVGPNRFKRLALGKDFVYSSYFPNVFTDFLLSKSQFSLLLNAGGGMSPNILSPRRALLFKVEL